MLRVLHLAPSHPDYETASALASLHADSSHSFTSDLRTIGDGGTHGLSTSAIFRLRRSRELAAIDLVHAWGPRQLTVAALAAHAGLPILYSPVEYPTRAHVRWLNAVMSYRDVNVVCPTDTMRRRFVERGVPIDRCHMIRPGVDFAKVRRRRDDDLRARLGFATTDRITLAVGESTRSASHDIASFALAVMHVMDRKHRLLVWGRGALAQKIARITRHMRQPSTIVATDRLGRSTTFESLLSAADDVLITASAPVSTLPIAICMAAGLPIVATVTPTVAELLEDRHTALMIAKPTAKLIAQRLLDLRADPNLQWSIADMARTEAFEFFTMSRFASQYRSAYQQAAAQTRVELPTLQAGAGLRFHGRG